MRSASIGRPIVLFDERPGVETSDAERKDGLYWVPLLRVLVHPVRDEGHWEVLDRRVVPVDKYFQVYGSLLPTLGPVPSIAPGPWTLHFPGNPPSVTQYKITSMFLGRVCG